MYCITTLSRIFKFRVATVRPRIIGEKHFFFIRKAKLIPALNTYGRVEKKTKKLRAKQRIMCCSCIYDESIYIYTHGGALW